MRTCFNCNGKVRRFGVRMNNQLLVQFVKELENVKTFVIVQPENLSSAVVAGGATLISMIGTSMMTNVNLNS